MSASAINMTLYRLLVQLGATESEAEQAARIDTSELVTQTVLKAELAELKADLQRFMLQALLGMTAIFAFIVGLFRVFL